MIELVQKITPGPLFRLLGVLVVNLKSAPRPRPDTVRFGSLKPICTIQLLDSHPLCAPLYPLTDTMIVAGKVVFCMLRLGIAFETMALFFLFFAEKLRLKKIWGNFHRFGSDHRYWRSVRHIVKNAKAQAGYLGVSTHA